MVANAKTVALACLVLLASIVAGCDGGDFGGPEISYNPTWIYINTNSLSTVTEASSVSLQGKAYCDTCPPPVTAFGYCPSVSYAPASSVDVTWLNATTGSGGPAVHAVVGGCSCLFSYCTVSYSHGWAVYSVPLVMGANDLRARAAYAGGVDEDSVIVTRVPKKVTGLTATAASGAVTLQWDSVPEAVSYNLYWSESPNFSKASAHVIIGANSPYVHAGLANDVTLYYRVSAVNGNFESATSAEVFATPGWPATVLAGTAATSEYREAALAVDALQHIHVHYAFDECLAYSSLPGGFSYCSQRVRANNYLSDQSGVPVVQPLPGTSYVDANIVLTSDATPHVSYAADGAVHGWLTGGAWSTESVDYDGWCGTSLAAESNDRLHLAYTGFLAAGNEIRYASNAAGVWTHETVKVLSTSLSCNEATPGRIAVAVDDSGSVRIAYGGGSPDYGLHHARQQAGIWSVEMVDSDLLQNLALAVDTAGLGSIVSVKNDGYLWLARQGTTGTWTSTTVNNERASGQPSVALDGDGQVHIAYIGLGNQLRYARQEGDAWRILALDGNAQSGADLALDALGKVHIVYFSGGQLKYVSNR